MSEARNGQNVDDSGGDAHHRTDATSFGVRSPDHTEQLRPQQLGAGARTLRQDLRLFTADGVLGVHHAASQQVQEDIGTQLIEKYLEVR